MSTTVVPNNNGTNGFMVVTHVVPSTHTAGQNVPATGFPTVVPVTHTTNSSNVRTLEKFLKGQPKALGTVQIMIGIVTILFGIVLTVHAYAISVYSGIVYWGSMIYIISGSLSVAAKNNLHSCLVKGSLGMNVVSAIVAGTAIILLSLDFIVYYYNDCYYYNYTCQMYYGISVSRSYGISGVLLVLSFVQFIISICVSAFACRATCCTEQTVPVVTVAALHGTCCPVMSPFSAHSSPQEAFVIPNPQTAINNPPRGNPPEYSNIIYKAEN